MILTFRDSLLVCVYAQGGFIFARSIESNPSNGVGIKN